MKEINKKKKKKQKERERNLDDIVPINHIHWLSHAGTA